MLSLIGSNGTGKSTVMGMISRLITKDSGAIDFENQDLSKWKNKELAKKLSILIQHNNIQMKLTVRKLVAFGRFPYSGSRLTPQDNEMIDKAISYNVDFEIIHIERFPPKKAAAGRRLPAAIIF